MKVILICITAIACTFIHETTVMNVEASRLAVEVARLQVQRDAAQPRELFHFWSRPNDKPSVEVVPGDKGLRL